MSPLEQISEFKKKYMNIQSIIRNVCVITLCVINQSASAMFCKSLGRCPQEMAAKHEAMHQPKKYIFQEGRLSDDELLLELESRQAMVKDRQSCLSKCLSEERMMASGVGIMSGALFVISRVPKCSSNGLLSKGLLGCSMATACGALFLYRSSEKTRSKLSSCREDWYDAFELKQAFIEHVAEKNK